MKTHIQVILIVLAVICPTIVLGQSFLRVLVPLSQETTVKAFENNKYSIETVTNYLRDSSYSMMGIDCNGDGKTVFANVDGYIIIDDLQVRYAINRLFRYGYITIVKNKTYIYFQYSSTLDFGSGVVYSIDGSQPQLQYLTKLIPLSDPNWYYYEEDYNEWRKRNGTY